MAKSQSGMGTAVDFGNGGRAEQAGKRHVGKSRTATQWRQDFKVGQELMSREEQGWVQVTAGMSRMGEGDGTDSPHRKATRARGESNTEEDGYCGAGQDGNIRKSRIGQQRRHAGVVVWLTRRLELLGRRKLMAILGPRNWLGQFYVRL